MSTVVTPCCGIGSQLGSQKSVGSKWVCESMKPGATVAPPASSSCSSGPTVRSGTDLGDHPVGDADVARGARASPCRRPPHPRGRGDRSPLRPCEDHEMPFYHSTDSHTRARPTGRRNTNEDATMGIFDCDTHCYETRDAFTRYMPKELLERSIFPVRLPDGTETILADRRVAVFNSEQGLGFDQAYRPGSLKEMLKQMASGNPDETYEPMPMRPEFQERPAADGAARAAGRRPLRALPVDDGAVGRAVRPRHTGRVRQHPLVQPLVRRDVGLRRRAHLAHRAAVVPRSRPLGRRARARARPGRARGAVPDRARARALAGRPLLRSALGAASTRPASVVAFHIMEHWYNEHIAPAWGLEPVPAPWHMSAWQWQNTYGERPIEDSLSALIFDNVFGRFPDLMVLASEFGASWVPHFVQPHGQEPGDGPQRPVDRRAAARAAERDLPSSRARRAVPGGRRGQDRGATSATPTRS